MTRSCRNMARSRKIMNKKTYICCGNAIWDHLVFLPFISTHHKFGAIWFWYLFILTHRKFEGLDLGHRDLEKTIK